MAGGLFNNKPFVINEKCIFFSLICMALFLFKPNFHSNITLYFSLFIIFVVAYVAMAWYDYKFDCQTLPLKKGSLGGITAVFKPDAHNNEKQKKHEETNKDKRLKMILIYLLHLLFIVPVLAYVAIYKTKTNKMIYPLLGVMAVFTALYHGIRLVF
tara:strand:- start:1026 stop:1493 length:468 start_codon:yes stop_codon:yes gene_type:complete